LLVKKGSVEGKEKKQKERDGAADESKSEERKIRRRGPK